MAEIKTYECDICKTLKLPSNNWWKVFIIKDKDVMVGVEILGWDSTVGNSQLDISVTAASAHLCGPDCVYKWLSKKIFGVPNG